MKVLKKQIAMANSFGVEAHLISPNEARGRFVEDIEVVGAQKMGE